MTSDAPAPGVPSSKWGVMLAITLVLQFATLALFSATICGCHFHAEALCVTLIPFIWGLVVIRFAITTAERAVAYFNALLMIAWIVLSWQGNIVYFFYPRFGING